MNAQPFPIAVGFEPAEMRLVVQAANPADGELQLALALAPEHCLHLATGMIKGALLQRPDLVAQLDQALEELRSRAVHATSVADDAISIAQAPERPQ